MKCYLVAGGAGYIGSNFVKYLMENSDAEAVILDNLSTGFRSSVDTLTGKYGKRLRFLKADIGEPNVLHPFLHKNVIDGVFHFAAYSLVGESQSDPLKYYNNNVSGTIRFLKVLSEHGISRMVFSSSAAVYGIPESVPIDEGAPRVPVNYYGATKAVIEDVLKALSETEDFKYAALRYFNVAGTDPDSDVGEMHDPETHLVPIAVRTALGRRKRLSVFGTDYDTADGTCIRDYIHVTDLCEAHLSAMSHIERHDESPVLNVGSRCGYSVREVIDAVEKVTGSPVAVTEDGRRPGDPPVLIASCSAVKKLLKWEPSRDLEQMVRDAVRWEKKR